jgi:hypothetical protein
MLKGESEIVFAILAFAGSSGIDDAMLALAKGGMRIRGVLDHGQANQGWAAPQVVDASEHRAVRAEEGRCALPLCASCITS